MANRPVQQSPTGLSTGIATAALALGRRFAAGGTMWCWAPGSPHHAQHLAVEFVHPVITGARALPAVSLLEDDAVAELRSLARGGDVLVVVAPADAPVAPLVRRAQAWGLTSVWLGAGPHPPEGTADHVLWLGDDSAAWHDGSVVLGYHLLWELTHVCFEHPGLLTPAPDTGEDGGDVCITCSDEGRLGEVTSLGAEIATVRTACGTETISTMLIPPVAVGDLVLVHAGMAITVVDA